MRILFQEILESQRNILGDPETRAGGAAPAPERDQHAGGRRQRPLDHAILTLTAWQAGREADHPIQTRLTQVRKEMNIHLTEAQAALRRLLLTHQRG